MAARTYGFEQRQGEQFKGTQHESAREARARDQLRRAEQLTERAVDDPDTLNRIMEGVENTVEPPEPPLEAKLQKGDLEMEIKALKKDIEQRMAAGQSSEQYKEQIQEMLVKNAELKALKAEHPGL